jgi:excisionase family DNA binding protein
MPRSKSNAPPCYYTTHQVAHALGVSPPTVVNWVRSGLLVASRTPGGHRRLRREDVVAFARACDYPTPPEWSDAPGSRVAEPDLPRIVVVDDDADFAELIQAFLQRRGRVEVHVALDGFEAGLTIARPRPHVVVLDLRMPALDGFEVLRRMQADPETRRVPVIACTGVYDAERDLRGVDGFRACFRKTMPLERLAELVDDAIAEASDGRARV